MKRRFALQRQAQRPPLRCKPPLTSRLAASVALPVIIILLYSISPRTTSSVNLTSASPNAIASNLSPSLLSDPSILLNTQFPYRQSSFRKPDLRSHPYYPKSAKNHASHTTTPQLCKYAVVMQTNLVDPPPSLMSTFIPTVLNQSASWCFFFCVSSHSVLPSWSSDAVLSSINNTSDLQVENLSSRLFLYTPRRLKATHFKSTKWVKDDDRVSTATRNLLYLKAMSHGSLAIFDASPDLTLRDANKLTSLAFNLSLNSQMAVSSNSTCKPNDEAPLFTNPWPLLRPMSVSHLTELHVRVWPRGMPPPDSRNACHRELAYGQKFDWDAVPAKYRSLVNVVSTAVDGIPDVDTSLLVSGAVPIAFRQRDVIASANAPFGSVAVMWGRQSLPLLFTPSSGALKCRASHIVRSLVARRLMGNRPGFGSGVVTRGLDRNMYDNSPNDPKSGDTSSNESYEEEFNIDAAVSLSTPRIEQFLVKQWVPKEGLQFGTAIVSIWDALQSKGVVAPEDVFAAADWVEDVASATRCDADPEIRIDSVRREVLKGGVCAEWTDEGKDTKATLPGAEDADTNTPEERGRRQRKPNVAVCVSGQLRTLTLPPGDKDHFGWRQVRSSLPPPNETVVESIQRVLYPKLGDPDVFMTVSTREREHEPKVGQLDACKPLRPPGGNIYCNVVKEERLPIYRNDSLWEVFAQVRIGQQSRDLVVQGLLQQLKGMYDCHEMLAQHAARLGKVYDWIVRLRPDMYFHSFPTLSQLSADNDGRTVWYANRDTCCCGNEDTFGIGPARAMSWYLNRYVHLQQRVWWFEDRHWSGESYTQWFLENFGMRLEPHKDIKSCIVKPLRRQGSSEP